MKYVKIIGTIGPASESSDIIGQLIASGMNVARLNLSHGSHEWHTRVISRVREVATRHSVAVALLLDLQGPRIRVGSMPQDGITLHTDQAVRLVCDHAAAPEDLTETPKMLEVPVGYDALAEDVRPGQRILMDDGLIQLQVECVTGAVVECRVRVGGLLRSHKGMNLPDSTISAPAITDKDQADLQFGLEHDVDYIALSFVRGPDDIRRIKDLIGRSDRRIPVIAKIERPEAIHNLTGIVEEADGVMIARGDLAIEMSPEAVPVLQKQIIREANTQNRLVITATQMLASMVSNPTPTRAEASDVANAVFDGTDAVMLSAETSAGTYPVESVRTMDRIIRAAENEIAASRMDISVPRLHTGMSVPEAMCTATAAASAAVGAKVVVVFTKSGATAVLMSKRRPTVPIIALTLTEQIRRQMALFWGVVPFVASNVSGADERVHVAKKLLKQAGLIATGDRIAILAGSQLGHADMTNALQIHNVN